MNKQEVIQAFAAMHTTGQYGKLTLSQLKAMCEFASEHQHELMALVQPQAVPAPENGYWVWRDENPVFIDLPESVDKASAEVEPVLDYINQHTTVRHMTPPFALNGERCCNCGLPAEISRAGMKWCEACIVELDEDYGD